MSTLAVGILCTAGSAFLALRLGVFGSNVVYEYRDDEFFTYSNGGPVSTVNWIPGRERIPISDWSFKPMKHVYIRDRDREVD